MKIYDLSMKDYKPKSDNRSKNIDNLLERRKLINKNIRKEIKNLNMQLVKNN